MSISKSKQPNLFLASIKERILLNPGSESETYHLVLDLKGSGIEYEVGDSLGIYPKNDLARVESILETLGSNGEEIVHEKYSLRTFLAEKANLNRLPKKIMGTHPDILSCLKSTPLAPQELCDQLSPMLPRFYSIASSRRFVGEEAHLTIALVPSGTCTSYLCKVAPLNRPVLPIFLQKSKDFKLPAQSHDKPIIMIGPGTGVAPFRAFMQERRHSENWLFFGERRRATDFYYKEFWKDLEVGGKLRLDCAFSRDQAEKVYVQHKLLRHAKGVWEWLERGAYVFVCGDASQMAKDVHKTLLQIIHMEAKCTELEAKEYLKALKKEGRYLRDVY